MTSPEDKSVSRTKRKTQPNWLSIGQPEATIVHYQSHVTRWAWAERGGCLTRPGANERGCGGILPPPQVQSSNENAVGYLKKLHSRKRNKIILSNFFFARNCECFHETAQRCVNNCKDWRTDFTKIVSFKKNETLAFSHFNITVNCIQPCTVKHSKVQDWKS